MISVFPSEMPSSSHWDWLDSRCSPGRASRSRVGPNLTWEAQGLGKVSPLPKGSREVLSLRNHARQPRYCVFPMVFATRRPGDSLWCLPHQCPGFPAQNWAAVWADTELTAGVFLSILQWCLKCQRDRPFTTLERGLKPGRQVFWLNRSYSHGAQQTKIHWLEIVAASAAAV